MSKLKPILFNTEMVKAILDGRKTTTRRAIKPQPEPFGKALVWKGGIYAIPHGLIVDAPYHKDDVLWVRETWCEIPYENNCMLTDKGIISFLKYAYKADSEVDYTGIWRPSIHMPFEVARIFLKVTNVSVERLQDITEEQARTEGCYHGPFFEGGNDDEIKARPNFIDLWKSTIKKLDVDEYGWDANPYVWVIEFERINKEDIPR